MWFFISSTAKVQFCLNSFSTYVLFSWHTQIFYRTEFLMCKYFPFCIHFLLREICALLFHVICSDIWVQRNKIGLVELGNRALLAGFSEAHGLVVQQLSAFSVFMWVMRTFTQVPPKSWESENSWKERIAQSKVHNLSLRHPGRMREHVSTKLSKRRKYPRDRDGEESCLPPWWQKPWLYSCSFCCFSLVKEFLQYLQWCCFSLSPISISTIPALSLPTPLHSVHWNFPPVPVICVGRVLPVAHPRTALLANFNSREQLFHLAGCRIFSSNPEKERHDVNTSNVYKGANDVTDVTRMQLQQFLNSNCMDELPSHFLTVTFSMPFLIIP